MKEKKEIDPYLKREIKAIYVMMLWAVVALFAFAAVAGAAVNVQIDTPTDGTTISNDDYVQVTGTASAIGGKGIDIVLVVDNSASLQEADPANWRDSAIHDMIYAFSDNADVNIGMVSFSSALVSKTVVNLGLIKDTRSSFDPALRDMKRDGESTAIGTAINIAKKALESGGRADASKVIVVFTDGNNNDGLEPSAEASAANAAGIKVSVVTLASKSCPNLPAAFQWACANSISNVNVALNEAIAQAGGGSHFTADNHETLVSHLGSPMIVNMDRVEIVNETTGEPSGVITLITGSFTTQVGIADGENTIAVTAYGTDGESAKATVKVTKQGEAPPPTPASRVKLRPQLIAAGFDPVLLDYTTSQFKILAMVRQGAVPIQDVSLTDNAGGLNMAMQLAGKLPNGDFIYEMTIPIDRGSDFSLPTIFGPDPGQFNIRVRDTGQQEHRFPAVEYGSNMTLTTTIPTTNAQDSNPQVCKRLQPQVIMGGFNPPLIDWDESSIGVIAVVRDGARPVYDVSLRMTTSLNMAMNLTETLPNGDKLYETTLTFGRGALPAASFRGFWGPDDSQFMIRVRDDAMQEHKFPDLRRGNYPKLSGTECWSDR
ncbi:MAG: VWA domain-containing protein [Desulfamplus sp.]|nr:VWA domain-containing protein [Desulfamplus sp.]